MDELRERIAEVIDRHVEGYSPVYMLDYGCVDAVLAEIERAGYSIVKAEDDLRIEQG